MQGKTLHSSMFRLCKMVILAVKFGDFSFRGDQNRDCKQKSSRAATMLFWGMSFPGLCTKRESPYDSDTIVVNILFLLLLFLREKTDVV